jgi:hypothetical protein
LLGLYIIDATDLEDALDVAKQLAEVNPGGSYEVRPIGVFNPDERSAAKA